MKSVPRREFRKVLCDVVKCLRSNLDAPGILAVSPAEIAAWLNQVTMEDLEAVWEKA